MDASVPALPCPPWQCIYIFGLERTSSKKRSAKALISASGATEKSSIGRNKRDNLARREHDALLSLEYIRPSLHMPCTYGSEILCCHTETTQLYQECKCNVNVNNLPATSESHFDNSGGPGPQAKGVNHLETPLRQLHVTRRASSCAKQGGHVQLCSKPRGARGIEPETFTRRGQLVIIQSPQARKPLDRMCVHAGDSQTYLVGVDSMS